MDVMEEMGHQCAVRSYWDLGPWALQSRQWRPMPAASQDIFQVLGQRGEIAHQPDCRIAIFGRGQACTIVQMRHSSVLCACTVWIPQGMRYPRRISKQQSGLTTVSCPPPRDDSRSLTSTLHRTC